MRLLRSSQKSGIKGELSQASPEEKGVPFFLLLFFSQRFYTMTTASDGFDLQSFYQALSVPTQEALDALPRLQRQPEAWQFALDMLTSNNLNCRFFGAHTLHVKISKDWSTLDEDRQDVLRSEILRLVVENCDGPTNILNKINQALISYALNVIPDRWPKFLPSAMETIQGMVQERGKGSASTGNAILDLLELFPEELNRTNIEMARHGSLIQDVKASLPVVLEVLTCVIKGLPEPKTNSNASANDHSGGPEFARLLGQESRGRTRAWKAIFQWLQFGIPSDTLFVPLIRLSLEQLSLLSEHQLRNSGVVDEEEVRAATIAVDDMLSNMKMAATHANTIGTMVLEALAQPWVASILKQSMGEGDSQRALQWGSMLISFGETYTEFIVGKSCDQQLGGAVDTFMQIMLVLTRFPGFYGFDEEVSDQPLNFWYLLQETMVDWAYTMDEEDDDPKGDVAQLIESTQAKISQVYVELLMALASKCAYPSADVWVEGDKEERDKFASYRREAGDALLNAYYVLRQDMLGLLVAEVANNLGAFSLANWQAVEALLFAMRSVGEAVPEDENTHLPRLFSGELLGGQLMPVLQTTFSSSDEDNKATQLGLALLQSSILGLIGAYGDWWKHHSEMLPVILPCVTSSLGQAALVPAAVAAFRRICDSCREQLAEASGNMIQLACQVLVAGDAVPDREQQKVIESVAEVIQVQPARQQVEALGPLLRSLASELDKGACLLESAPSGTPLGEIDQFLDPLVSSLQLLESLARGLQLPDDSEEMALLGDSEAVGKLTSSSRCYQQAEDMVRFREIVLQIFRRVFAVSAWQRNSQTGMLAMDDRLIECLLAVINSTTRRGPHALSFGLSESMNFVMEAWSVAIGSSNNGSDMGLGDRWSDQCPAFLQCMAQLVTVYAATTKAASASACWHNIRSNAGVVVGSMLTRAIRGVGAGIAREADNLATAIEQQPVISEYLFDLCTKVLQAQTGLLAYIDQDAVASICELSVQALSVPNRLALRPTAYFLSALIRQSSTNNDSKNTSTTELLGMLWTRYGMEWLRIALLGIGGMHPRSLLPNLSELLFYMLKHHPAVSRQWMKELLSQSGFPSSHVSDNAKRQFVRQTSATRSLIKFKAIVSDFATVCRNLQGVDYVA